MKPVLIFCLALWVMAATSAQAQPPRYTASADGQEVTDSQTGLIWRRCAEGMNWDGSTCAGAATPFTHEAALQRATAQAASSGKAWRLPNVKELSSIVDKSRSYPAIDPTAFPATPSSLFGRPRPALATPTTPGASISAMATSASPPAAAAIPLRCG